MNAPAPTPEWMAYARALCALVFVIGLIFISAAIARRYGFAKHLQAGKAQATLKVIETLYLDPKHRLVRVKSDDKEHLLLIGATGNLLIESRPGSAPHDA